MEKIILVIALLICLFTDIKQHRILNTVTIPMVIFGFLFNLFTRGITGLQFSVMGFFVGFALLLIPYLLGGMGAGDVKLLAAIGALMGVSFVFNSFIYTALIGGVIALFIILKTNGLYNSIKSLFFTLIFFRNSSGSTNLFKLNKSSILFPYGIPIVLGTIITLLGG